MEVNCRKEKLVQKIECGSFRLVELGLLFSDIRVIMKREKPKFQVIGQNHDDRIYLAVVSS